MEHVYVVTLKIIKDDEDTCFEDIDKVFRNRDDAVTYVSTFDPIANYSVASTIEEALPKCGNIWAEWTETYHDESEVHVTRILDGFARPDGAGPIFSFSVTVCMLDRILE